jgi:RNA polymerase sigma-70 factor (ECF subfamily)
MHVVAWRRTGGGVHHLEPSSAPDADGALLVRAQREPTVFGDFYDRNREGVARYFLRLTGSPHVAAELTAETFAEALVALHRYEPARGSGATWLYTIATRQYHRYLRRGEVARRYRVRTGVATTATTVDDVERIVELVARAEDIALLRAALDELSAGVRAAVELRVGYDLPYAEVAARLGCSEGSARVRVARGMRHLTAVLVGPS